MEFQKVMQNLNKGHIQPLYTIIGEEDYLKNQFLEKLYRLLGDMDSVDTTRFDLNEVSMNDVLDEAETFSFFSDYRVIYVTNVQFLNANTPQKLSNQEQKRLLDYIKNPNDASIILLFSENSKIDKRKKVSKAIMADTTFVDISNLSEGEVARYVQTYINHGEVGYTKDAIQELLIRTNYNLTSTMNELMKLNMYGKTQGVINIETVRQLVPRTLESDVFQLTNAVVAKQMDRAILIYKDLLLMKHEPIALHALMVSQFRIIVQSLLLKHQGLNEGDIAKQLAVHPYRVKLAVQASRTMQLNELLDFYIELAEIDYQMKTGIGVKESYFYILLTKLNYL